MSEKQRMELEYVAQTQTLVGETKRLLRDMETGEEILVDQITKRIYGTKNFWKVYLMDFLSVLGIMDNKQVDIFIYIVQNTNQSNNMFIGTYKKIANDAKCSEPTIAKIMKKLQDHKFISKVQNGVWMVNPNIIMRGTDYKRQILLSYFDSPEPINKISYNRWVITSNMKPRKKRAEDETDEPKLVTDKSDETDEEKLD